MMKLKTHCIRGHEFTVENTGIRTSKNNGKRVCKQCGKDRFKARVLEISPAIRKSLARKGNIKFNYNLSSSELTDILIAQNFRCANPSCDEIDSEDNHLTVDHDHSCCSGRKSCGKCIRGLLCSSCNRVLGFVNDNPEKLNGLLEYLLSWKKSSKDCGSVETKII